MKTYLISESFDDGEVEILNLSIFEEDKETLKEKIKDIYKSEGLEGNNSFSIMFSREIEFPLKRVLKMVDNAQEISEEEINVLRKFQIRGGFDIIRYIEENLGE